MRLNRCVVDYRNCTSHVLYLSHVGAVDLCTRSTVSETIFTALAYAVLAVGAMESLVDEPLPAAPGFASPCMYECMCRNGLERGVHVNFMQHGHVDLHVCMR